MIADNRKVYDKIIIGAGLYGMYAALYCAKKGEKVLVLEYDTQPFARATYVNQARVHMGYHYPRSLSTAVKSAGYFKRFVEEYRFCIHSNFDQIYATSAKFSWTDGGQFVNFCKSAGIRCDEIAPGKYFKAGMCDGAYMTQEYTYDAVLLRDFFIKETLKFSNLTFCYQARIDKIVKEGSEYIVCMKGTERFAAGYLLNATYASTNQILALVEGEEREPFEIKYELCEIILCKPSQQLKNVGITVMDGPFFSIMPFGKTGYHSLTSVTFTPHVTSYEDRPVFACQGKACSPEQLNNCNLCHERPESAWPYMDRLAVKYLREEYGYEYVESLFSMKPILKTSEVDDSRPTRIRVDSKTPTLISVLSGKINTVYDLEEFL